MKHFARLFYELDQSNKTNDKIGALLRYFENTRQDDILWMLALFTGRRPRRVVSARLMSEWAAEEAGIPMWLFAESYSVVGDLSETIALLLPDPVDESNESLAYWFRYVEALSKLTEPERKEAVLMAWRSLKDNERFVFNKLSSSTFRVGVSQNLVIRALEKHTGIDRNTIAHRLMGHWDPHHISFKELILEAKSTDDLSKPYPFFLAYPLENGPEELGEPEDWQAEWKWDGIRSQIISREGEIYIWSRGEDLVTDRFPELQAMQAWLPDGTVIDGEILPYADGQVLSFAILQTRLGRKNITPKILKDAPVVVFAYDLLEWQGEDIRERPLSERRALLEKLVESANFKPYLQLSPTVTFSSWEDLATQRETAREMLSEGIMLKRKSAPYQVGRKRGDWWKWKVDPFSVDAVLIYAQRGSGRRANLYTDYTFAIWRGKELVPFAKAYSGLTDKDILQVDRWIRQNTIEKFGPVRTVKPEQVFELGFEGIQRSKRHKSGIAVRFPRILRWRIDKKIDEADTIEVLEGLVENF